MLHNGTLAAQVDEIPDTYIKQNICAGQQEYNIVHIVRRGVTIWKHVRPTNLRCIALFRNEICETRHLILFRIPTGSREVVSGLPVMSFHRETADHLSASEFGPSNHSHRFAVGMLCGCLPFLQQFPFNALYVWEVNG